MTLMTMAIDIVLLVSKNYIIVVLRWIFKILLVILCYPFSLIIVILRNRLLKLQHNTKVTFVILCSTVIGCFVTRRYKS